MSFWRVHCPICDFLTFSSDNQWSVQFKIQAKKTISVTLNLILFVAFVANLLCQMRFCNYFGIRETLTSTDYEISYKDHTCNFGSRILIDFMLAGEFAAIVLPIWYVECDFVTAPRNSDSYRLQTINCNLVLRRGIDLIFAGKFVAICRLE